MTEQEKLFEKALEEAEISLKKVERGEAIISEIKLLQERIEDLNKEKDLMFKFGAKSDFVHSIDLIRDFIIEKAKERLKQNDT